MGDWWWAHATSIPEKIARNCNGENVWWALCPFSFAFFDFQRAPVGHLEKASKYVKKKEKNKKDLRGRESHHPKGCLGTMAIQNGISFSVACARIIYAKRKKTKVDSSEIRTRIPQNMKRMQIPCEPLALHKILKTPCVLVSYKTSPFQEGFMQNDYAWTFYCFGTDPANLCHSFSHKVLVFHMKRHFRAEVGCRWVEAGVVG